MSSMDCESQSLDAQDWPEISLFRGDASNLADFLWELDEALDSNIISVPFSQELYQAYTEAPPISGNIETAVEAPQIDCKRPVCASYSSEDYDYYDANHASEHIHIDASGSRHYIITSSGHGLSSSSSSHSSHSNLSSNTCNSAIINNESNMIPAIANIPHRRTLRRIPDNSPCTDQAESPAIIENDLYHKCSTFQPTGKQCWSIHDIDRLLSSPTDPIGKFLRDLNLTSRQILDLDLMSMLEQAPRKPRVKYGPRKAITAEERQQLSKERNREHAKATRLRKRVFKELLESSKVKELVDSDKLKRLRSSSDFF